MRRDDPQMSKAWSAQAPKGAWQQLVSILPCLRKCRFDQAQSADIQPSFDLPYRAPNNSRHRRGQCTRAGHAVVHGTGEHRIAAVSGSRFRCIGIDAIELELDAGTRAR